MVPAPPLYTCAPYFDVWLPFQRRLGMHGVTEVLLRHSDAGWLGTMMGEDVSTKHGGFNMF